MAIIKCKMCGGDLMVTPEVTVAECEYCGTKQTVPTADNEKKLTLFARANRLRLACEFDKAAGVYESIVAEFPEEAEAYWGLILCRYGIEYVDDPATGKKIPTCHRSSFDSVMEDSDFEQTCENADVLARRVYRDEAKVIEELRKGILEVSGKEAPYDIFICYKETDETGDRTIDSVIAQDVYDALTEKGYRVFFSRISLEDKLGTEYEPYIFAALNSAKVMLVFGTDYEYFNAVWVKNEWSRFLKLMAADKTRYLIPCYKGIDAYDMPKEFAKLQAQDMGKVGAIQDLMRGIEKILGQSKESVAKPEPVAIQNSGGATTESLLQRAKLFLEDKDWEQANTYFDKVLDIDPQCAEAYLGKAMAELKSATLQHAANCKENEFDTNKNLARAKQFGDETLKEQIAAWRECSMPRFRQKERRRSCNPADYTIEDGVLKKYTGDDTDIEIPGSVTCIGEWAFSGRSSLTSVVILDSVTSIENCAFQNCSGLTSIEIPDSVTSIGKYAFQNCSGLTSIEIPDSVTSIEDCAFQNCSGLRSIEIPDSVTSIEDCAFQNCSGLTEIGNLEHVKDIGDAVLAGCSSLPKEYFELWPDAIYINGAVFSKDQKTFRYWVDIPCDYTIPEGVTAIGNYAFYSCENLTSVVIPDGVTSIGDSAFYSCDNLTSIVIPNGVTSIGEWAFFSCENLTSIEMPDSVTSIGDFAFQSCSSLTSVEIPNGVTNIGRQAFAFCKNLTSIEIPDSVTRIGEYAFGMCSSLTSIEIPDSVTSIGEGAFYHCDSLTSIEIPDSVTSIGKSAFSWCSSLTSIEIPDSVTSIGEEAFYQCDSLTIMGRKNSAAERYAAGENIKFKRVLSEEEKEALSKRRSQIAQVGQLIACGPNHVVGLKSDGTVVAVRSKGQLLEEFSDWQDIVAISAGYHTVGLHSDGTVVATGSNYDGQCDVSGWTDIVAIGAGGSHTVGLRSDGTVVAVGKNEKGQCNVSDWKDIAAISAGSSHTVGLRSDGTVVAVGDNQFDQCNVCDWKDIVAISAGSFHTVGLRSDGTVVTVGSNTRDQCDVSGWQDIVAISAGTHHTLGLRSDGTVVAVGAQTHILRSWKDIVAIGAGPSSLKRDYYSAGVKSDGTVVVVDFFTDDGDYIRNWKLFGSLDTLEQERKDARKRAEEERIAAAKRAEEERKRAAEERVRRMAELQQQKDALQTELANLKGLFTGRRRKEIEAQIEEIDAELSSL